MTSLDLIEAMYTAAKAAQPITGRGVGYKLFTLGLIPSMATSEMAKVYRLLRIARERDDIPWDWIVDETRELERVSTWDDPAEYARCVARSYRREFWNQQPARVEVWSEKGTVRGVIAPVLDEYAVGFRVMHGFGSATSVYDIAQDDDGRPLIILYVGDFDPSGLYMSEHDLPDRFDKYGGDHIELRRIALAFKHLTRLPSFPAKDKRKDPRYKWFRSNYGARCLETRRDGPARSAPVRRARDQEADRARRVETLRGREQGRTGIAPHDPRLMGADMSARIKKQAPIVPTTIEDIMRSPTFQLGVAHKRAGTPPIEIVDDWNYERGRQWASVAPSNMPVLIDGKLNSEALLLYWREPIL